MQQYLIPLCFIGIAFAPDFIRCRLEENLIPEVRIVGGNDSSIEDHPYMAAIWQNGHHRCGGTIITKNYILTAAHCLHQDASTFKVRVGSANSGEGGVVHTVVRKVLTDEKIHDLALLQLGEDITFTSTVQPVKLVRTSGPVKLGTVGTVLGWGTRKRGGPHSAIMQEVDLTVTNTGSCNATSNVDVAASKFCAGYEGGGRGTCVNDAGDPFMVNGTQIGMAINVVNCGKPDEPAVFVNLALYRSWFAAEAGLEEVKGTKLKCHKHKTQ